MGLFFKKKAACCCGNCNTTNEHQDSNSDIKILGSGCAKCNELEANTVEALKQLSIDQTIDHVSDFAEIAKYGVMTTPAIVYKNKVLSYGKVLSTSDIIDLLQKEIN